MEFHASNDIDAPRAAVFAALTDFDMIEGRVSDMGVAITRQAAEGAALAGMAWQARFKLRGKARIADITLTEATADETLAFDAKVGGLNTRTDIMLTDAPGGGTRVAVSSVLDPQTLSARLIVQSLKLARGRLETRFSDSVAKHTSDLAARLKNGA